MVRTQDPISTEARWKSAERPPQVQSTEGRFRDWEVDDARWIDNDGLLRDEGIVFGLSGLPPLPESKIEAIEAYYNARIARYEATRQALLEKRDRLRERVDELSRRIELLSDDLWETPGLSAESSSTGDSRVSPEANEQRTSQSGRATRPPDSGGIVRYTLGLLFALTICGLAYFTVREVLGDQVRYPELIAIGVMLAGMFTVFAPASLLFSSDRSFGERPWEIELWKVRLAEIGFPIVAAGFVVLWGERRDPIRESIAFVFLSLLFLLGGRLLLSLVTRSSHELEYVRDRYRQRRRVRLRKHERKLLRAENDELMQQIAALEEQIRLLPSVDELRAECRHKVAVFQSEYELARAAMQHGHTENLRMAGRDR